LNNVFPKKLWVAAEAASTRLPFLVAPPFQDRGDNPGDTELVNSKVAESIVRKKRQQIAASHTPVAKDHVVDTPLTV
jgi:hypothetical protein